MPGHVLATSSFHIEMTTYCKNPIKLGCTKKIAMIIVKVLPHSNVSKMMPTERQTVVDLHCLPEYIGSLQYEPQHDKTNKTTCAPSEDLDQPGHPSSLIRVFAVCMKNSWALSYPMSAQGRLWSDWVDAQADWVFAGRTGHFVGFVMQRFVCLLNNGTWNAWIWKWHEIRENTKNEKLHKYTLGMPTEQ